MLKSANAGDLPVGEPAKFDLVINLKTAKAFGVTIPPNAADVRYWHKADIGLCTANVCFRPKADIGSATIDCIIDIVVKAGKS